MKRTTKVYHFNFFYMIYLIDLFCGGGGTSTGASKAEGVKVIYCVNHDPLAIKSHASNHPECVHAVEDILMLDFSELKSIIAQILVKDKNAIFGLWASLECTNFSKAKGGKPRDADSRTLANGLFRYVEELPIDIVYIENVMEFMDWGPLDKNGKPIKLKKGDDYLKWVEKMKTFGFEYDWKKLNSANYGAYTSRTRYFSQFVKQGFAIEWPEATHDKKDTSKKRWRAVKEVLDLQDHGKSIFNRKKDLVDNTLERIYAGLVKFVANGDDSFIMKYFSGRPEGKVIATNGPAGAIKTIDSHSLVNCNFILKYNSLSRKGIHIHPSIYEPCPTVAVQNRLGLTTVEFLHSYYGNGGVHSENEPCPTVSTHDRFGKIRAEFMLDQQYGNSKPRSIQEPAGTVTAVPKLALVETSFIFNPQFKSAGNSIENPCPVIIARQDKRPLSLVSCIIDENEIFQIPIYKSDSEIMIKIKVFMAHYGITDIKMRMLKIVELLQIQGFPRNYQLFGKQKDQKKFIGNAVEVTMAWSIMQVSARKNNLLKIAC